MRYFILGLMLFAAAVGLALTLSTDPGNVVVFYPPYRIDLSLNLFLLLEIGAFIVVYSVIRIARKTVQMPARVAQYRQRQSEKRAGRALRGALQAHFEGRYGHAEREAEAARELPETAGLAALIGARSAHRMREYGRRDEWLKRAEAEPALRAAKLMTEAECLVDARDGTRALVVVEQLHAAGARHIQSQRLALKAHQYAGDWENVLKLLRTLSKRDVLHPAAAREIKTMAWRALFAARGNDAHALINLWQSVPTADRRIADVALVAAKAFNAADLGPQARLVLEGALAHEWDARLVEEYARGRGPDDTSAPAREQIERAERWVSDHPGDSAAGYALGVLCARDKLWGKAQSALKNALLQTSDARLAARLHLELARVYEAIGDVDAAMKHFREAASRSAYD